MTRSDPGQAVFAFDADPDRSDEYHVEDEDYNPFNAEAVYAYEDELDILAILGWRFIIPDDQEEYGDYNTRVKLEQVTLFDNKSYAELRTIHIDHAVKLGTSEQPSLSLDLDRDILLIRIRTTSKTRTLIWRLVDDGGQANKTELRSMTSLPKATKTTQRNRRQASFTTDDENYSQSRDYSQVACESTIRTRSYTRRTR